MENKVENKVKNKGHANLIPCKPGEIRNPNGRPKGAKSYSTLMWEAMKKIATERNMTPEELEELLYRSGFTQALKGDFRYWNSHMDRVHGKPKLEEGELGTAENPHYHIHKVLWQ